MRSDLANNIYRQFLRCISIHAPHARSDQTPLGSFSVPLIFQSTLLMRGATPRWNHPISPPRFQSTLLMRGATLPKIIVLLIACIISIHAPHARSDIPPNTISPPILISIHAPHARSDRSAASVRSARSNFNPRSSCEERQAELGRLHHRAEISIHAPHARSD